MIILIKKYIYIFIGFLIVGLSVTTFILWKSNGILREEKTRIQIELTDTQTKLQNALNANVKIQEYNTELAKTVDTYRLKSQDLQSKLSKLELKANSIAIKHPKLLSNAVNNATKKVNECFEKISKGQECEETSD